MPKVDRLRAGQAFPQSVKLLKPFDSCYKYFFPYYTLLVDLRII